MSESERRRRRPAVSCSLCRRRKIRCNRESPCSNCVRSGVEHCVYDNNNPPPLARPRTQAPGPVAGPLPTLAAGPPSSTTALSTAIPRHSPRSLAASSTASTLAASGDVDGLTRRIKQLEDQLSKVAPTSAPSPNPNGIETTTSRIGGIIHVHREQGISRSISHKKRLFGQSHWINAVVSLSHDTFNALEPYLLQESKALSGIQKCKSLARVIKARRRRRSSSPPISEFPPKDVADDLVDCYLRTSETVYRILHIPTFRRDYEALWVSDAEPDAAFLIQLKLVLAIGATTYDAHFSLRASAVRWIHEAHIWLSDPAFIKARVGIQSLQTNLLLLVARETAGVGEEFIWISTGALYRKAIYMGLNRDPTRLPPRTAFVDEMHRRLWNTVLEIALKTSLTSGGPPLISFEDFDTAPPGSFDDEQLVTEDPVPRPDGDFTQVSIARALRKTFPLRLTVVKFLNSIGSTGSYEETLRLDSELRTAFKDLRRVLQKCRNSSARAPASSFEVLAVDFLMQRYISAIHVPFFGPALHESAYAFSRKVVIETSLKVWCTAYPSSSIMAAAALRNDMSSSSSSPPSGQDDIARLALCGAGFYRTVAMQAALLIAVELKAQLQEEESLGPVPLRSDLLSVLEDAKAWCLEGIRAGETNIKGHLLTSIVAAYIQGLLRGLDKDELGKCLGKAAEESTERCIPILEDMAAQGQVDDAQEINLPEIPMEVPPGELQDWDFMTADAQFNFGNPELIGWLFNDLEAVYR
ncbi:hypothetical protein B0H63DRAFT_475812 [Podospora didyma]|uniref:Zn(2)-C6 fungal-type domain-containing protein n=1 Tax=Podospora didyma TaxID=330526 RepID=A0AAE0NH73_9PEZI|nr:hypothetical protein B0H63DRAFT_475812 [Podospora didyma]